MVKLPENTQRFVTTNYQGLIAIDIPDDRSVPMTLYFKNVWFGTTHERKLSYDRFGDLADFMNMKKLLQDAFPDWDKDERELFLSGLDKDEWAKVFPPEEENK